MFGWMAGFGGMGLALMYLAVSAVGVRGLWHQVSHTKLLVAAAAGVLVSAGAIFGNVYKAQSPLNKVLWALLVWVAIGAAWSFVALRRPAQPAPADRALTAEAAVQED
jgi:hypothetical protein